MASLAPSSGIAFGFRWSLVGCFTALLYIASCDLFIPPDRSVPRYNTVHGQGKRPALNPGGSSYQPSQNTQAQRERSIDDAYGSGSSAPIQGATAMPMAPLPKTQDEDGAFVAPNSSVARRAQVKEEESGFWDSLAFWESDDEEPAPRPQAQPKNQPEEAMSGVGAAAPTAPVIAADLPPMQTDANGYPVLSQTPPVPSNEAISDTQQRALSSQHELEAGRQGAIQMQGRVAAEAAAEPSLLSTYPQGAPRPAAPSATPAPGPQSRAVPLENPSQAMLGGTTATASAAPSQQPVVVRGTVASMPSGGVMEPIRLNAPGATPDPGVAGAMSGNATPGVITLTPPAPRYANSDGYLPESRYTQRNPSRLTGPYATVQ